MKFRATMKSHPKSNSNNPFVNIYSAAWLQQKGKDEEQCIREYIALFALCDPAYA